MKKGMELKCSPPSHKNPTSWTQKRAKETLCLNQRYFLCATPTKSCKTSKKKKKTKNAKVHWARWGNAAEVSQLQTIRCLTWIEQSKDPLFKFLLKVGSWRALRRSKKSKMRLESTLTRHEIIKVLTKQLSVSLLSSALCLCSRFLSRLSSLNSQLLLFEKAHL